MANEILEDGAPKMLDHEPEYFVQKSPFWNMTQRSGCRRYATVNGMYYLMLYTDETQEYWKLIKDVTLWDVTAAESPIEISGTDAAKFIDLLITRNVDDCPIGRCRYFMFVDSSGGMISDSVLLRLAEDRFWMSGNLSWIRGVAVFADMNVSINRPGVAVVQLQGPRSQSLMGDILGTTGRDLGHFHLSETDLCGLPVVVTRTGWSGELGYEVYLSDTGRADEVWESIMEAGRHYGIAVTASSEMRRVEAGILNGGTDFSPEYNPYEVGLGRWVDLEKKSDFIGKDALRGFFERGVTRRLVGIEIAGALESRFTEPWPVIDRGDVTGKVTIAVHSPALEKTIGFAMVPQGLSGTGASFHVGAPWGRLLATVVPYPFVDPGRQRARA